jgi:manganese/iron transport system ATP-binding protein/manganese/zinc/iron transport system ATP- binding protein
VLIQANELSLGYDAGAVLVGVNFVVRTSERVALLGPNGGGKSTLLRAISGDIAPQGGALVVSATCGVVPQREHARLDYPVSALDVALMGSLPGLRFYQRPGRREREAALRGLEAVGLADRAGTTFGELSGGQRQRVLIARALVQGAQLLLLDEPFNGLDRSSAERLERLVAELSGEGRAVLIATHDLGQARVADKVLCLNGRQIAFGRPTATLTRPVLMETYDSELAAFPDGDGEFVLRAHHCAEVGA